MISTEGALNLPKDPSNAILIIDNKNMEKTKDQMHKPSTNSAPLAPKKSAIRSPGDLGADTKRGTGEGTQERGTGGPLAGERLGQN